MNGTNRQSLTTRADVPVLWPPDHRMIEVHILGVVDAENNATITINSVPQDEPTNGLGDGDTPVDATTHYGSDALCYSVPNVRVKATDVFTRYVSPRPIRKVASMAALK